MSNIVTLGGSSLKNLMHLQEGRSKRISSWNTSGRNADRRTIPQGESLTFAHILGAGCINHIWITIACEDELYPRKMLLRMYWDGEDNPSVDVPVGDFFGTGHGIVKPYMSLALNIVGHSERRPNRGGMNCFFPMPFAENAKLVMVNECDTEVRAFYYYVDYEELEGLGEDTGRFHAQWRCQNPCDGLDWNMPNEERWALVNLDGHGNYVILEAEGRGHYVGCNLSVHNLDPRPGASWFGEGDDMIFIDGEIWPPSLHGTGTEDYFCAAWGFPSGEYGGPYHGISVAGDPKTFRGKWTAYRHHIEDPVRFSKSIRVTIEHGHANNHSDDYSSTAYWYQTEPHRVFPTMLPVEERLPRPASTF